MCIIIIYIMYINKKWVSEGWSCAGWGSSPGTSTVAQLVWPDTPKLLTDCTLSPCPQLLTDCTLSPNPKLLTDCTFPLMPYPKVVDRLHTFPLMPYPKVVDRLHTFPLSKIVSSTFSYHFVGLRRPSQSAV